MKRSSEKSGNSPFKRASILAASAIPPAALWASAKNSSTFGESSILLRSAAMASLCLPAVNRMRPSMPKYQGGARGLRRMARSMSGNGEQNQQLPFVPAVVGP